jgi:TolB protein
MQDFCTANPDAVGIPMSVTGHDMVYAWKCNGTSAEIQSQISQVDEAGFIANIWFAIDPNAKLPAATAVPTALDAGQGQILFASKRGGDTFDLYLLNLSSGQVQRLTQRDSNIFPGPFSSDGSRILITGYGLTRSYVGVLSADGTNPVNLTDNDNIDEGFAAWSPDGKQIAFTSRRNGNNEIYIMDSQGKHVQPLTSNPHDDFAPAWSPDGNQIAFVSDRDHSNGTNSIYIIDANGMKVKRLTYDKGSDYSPAWSPDGKQIAFRSDLNGSSNIYLVNADGSQLTELTGSTGDNWWPVWSSDGKRIAFQSNRDGNWEIYLMNSDGSDARNVTNNPADDEMPEWQP